MSRSAVVGLLASVLVAFGSCGTRDSSSDSPRQAVSEQADRVERVESGAVSLAPSGRPRIVVLGDSLTAGLGLAPADAYPALLQQRLDVAKLNFEVVNAGVSGDTSAGGLRRVDWALDGDVRILVVALGGNDGLRGIPVDELRRNIAGIVERAKSRGVSVIIAGMEAPPNFGDDYTKAFRQVYSDLARKYDVPLIPFLLERVAGIASLNQRDGIHPNAAGARIVAENVWSIVRPIAEQAAAEPGGRHASGP